MFFLILTYFGYGILCYIKAEFSKKYRTKLLAKISHVNFSKKSKSKIDKWDFSEYEHSGQDTPPLINPSYTRRDMFSSIIALLIVFLCTYCVISLVISEVLTIIDTGDLFSTLTIYIEKNSGAGDNHCREGELFGLGTTGGDPKLREMGALYTFIHN